MVPFSLFQRRASSLGTVRLRRTIQVYWERGADAFIQSDRAS